MIVVEWCYSDSTAMRIKYCHTQEQVAFWYGFAVNTGATLITCTRMGVVC